MNKSLGCLLSRTIRRRGWGAFGLFLSLCLVGSFSNCSHAEPSGAIGGESLQLRAVLELPYRDYFMSIDAKSVITECSQALKDNRHHTDMILARILKRRGEAYAAESNFKEAKADFDKAIDLQPSDCESKWERCIACARLGDDKGAKKELDNLVRDFPKYAPPYVTLAHLLLAQGDYDAGIRLASKAIALDPRLGEAYYIRSQAYFATSDYQKCLTDMNHFIELMPFKGEYFPEHPYLIRGKALLILEKHEDAIFNFQMARRLNASSFEPLFWLWRANVNVGRTHVSYMMSLEMLKTHGDNPLAYTAQATSLNLCGRPKQALTSAQKGLTLEADSPELHAQLGAAYDQLGKYEDALKEFDIALRNNPDHISALCGKAYVYATCPDDTLRNGKRAQELAKKCCDLTDNKNVIMLGLLSEAQAENDQMKEAIRTVKECLDKCGKNEDMKGRLEKLLAVFENGRPYRREYDPKPINDE